MLHVAVCDDERTALQELAEEVRRWAEAEGEACSVETFASADAFWFVWEERKDLEVLLLDIEMPGMDGMELARRLRQAGEPIGIIFVTGNPDFALEGYDLEAVSYVMKPVRRERLHAALSRARERMARRAAVLLPLSGGELERLYIADICCLESDGHASIVWKKDGTKLVSKMGTQQLEQELENCSDAFFKPHRSYFINLAHVERIGKKDVRMGNQLLVPIARGKWEPLNQAYLRYFRGQSF
ncbi:MAG: response regulator transcription factor [Lachnospiraceae bacterium]|jgi:DNA-binding LytR/AlgR family response regulator|nr:response regulator transcription factor [Lachnospiraceae bacterium]